MVNNAMRSAIERSVEIGYADLTHDEKESIDRIKFACALLSRRERSGSPTDLITDLSVAIAHELRRSTRGHTVDAALVRLNDAICQQERDGGAGHTLVLIPHDPAEPVRVSLDGKPVDVSIERATEVAFIARTGEKPPKTTDGEWFLVPGSTGVRARALIPPGGEVGIYLLEFAPAGEIHVHKRKNEESLYVVAGAGHVYTTAERELLPGDAARIASGAYHSVTAGHGGMTLVSVARPDWSAT